MNPTSAEDRIWAVLSHLSVLAFGIGILLPVVGWSDQRRKSKYASFQCLQALGYQSLGYTVWILFTLLVIIAIIFAMLPAISITDANGGNVDSVMGEWMSVIFVIMIGLIGLYAIFPVIAVITCALGRNYRYPIMGNRLSRYLNFDSTKDEWLIEDHEDRWVAAMGHFGVIIILWGILASLTVWILQGKRNLFLKFQSIQTFVYQASVTLLIISTGLIYMIGFFVFIVMIAFGENYSALNYSPGIGGLVFIILSMLSALVFVLVVPLFQILGQYAGYRVLKGDDFRYPVIGRLVEKYMRSQLGSQTQIEQFDIEEKPV